MSNLQKLISLGSFLEAKKLIHDMGVKQLKDTLVTIGYDNENICAYSFVCFLIFAEEKAEYHALAGEVLVQFFPYLTGAYETALYHTRRAIELDPNDIDNYGMLLFFHALPLIKPLISQEEARSIAIKILAVNPNHVPAQHIIYGAKKTV